MTLNDQICNEYFDWLHDLVCGKRYSKAISYRKLLMTLHSIEFRYSIARDADRAMDGTSLRYRFARQYGYANTASLTCMDIECSVLEMMVALSIRCEEDYMDDPLVGDRTGQWFWGMIVNLGLGSMVDSRFDKQFVENIIERFLNREYEPNGKGGLFTVRNCNVDLRDVEIWYQLCYFLDTII